MVINGYCDGEGDGPNPDDLRIDFNGNKDSHWNVGVQEILLDKLLERRDEDDWRLPDRPNEYFEDMIASRLKALTRVWKKSQPALKRDGQLETPEEVESRVVEERSRQNKKQRPFTRRTHVSASASCTKYFVDAVLDF